MAHTYYILDGGTQTEYTGTPISITTEGVHSLEFWSVDNANNEETHQTVTIKIDLTDPTISGTATTPPNGNNWYNDTVTIHWTCSDPDLIDTNQGSGIASCPDDQMISSEGTNQTVDGTATDNAGNSATATSDPAVNIDLTDPTVTYVGNQGTYTADQTITITCSAADNLSGIDSTTCANVNAPAYTFGPGSHTLSATATDKAGNTGSGSTAFTVGVTTDSLAAVTAKLDSNPVSVTQLRIVINGVALANRTHNTALKTYYVNLYIQLVRQQTGHGITPQYAQILINLAEAI